MVSYPNDWKETTLGDLGEVRMCKRIFQSQTRPSGQIPFYKIGTFGGTPDAYISRELFENYKSLYSFPQKGDVLISAAGTIGRTVVYDGKDAYFQDSNIVWLEVDPDEVDRKFLMYFYQSYPWINLEGTTISRLYNGIIRKTPICLPRISEQRTIAETLGAFDTHITNLSKLIEKKRAIRDGALEDLVSGRTRLAGFSSAWKDVSFTSVIVPKARIGWQGLRSEEYLRKGYSYLIGGTDFSNGTISLDDIWYVAEERYSMDSNIQVSENDVLVTKDGTIGKVAIVPHLDQPATLNSGVYVFRTKNGLCRGFLYRILQSSIFRCFIDNLAAGSTILHLYQKDLKNFSFMMPTEEEEQMAISQVLKAMDDEIKDLEDEHIKMIQIREGAMDDLLNGRVRLKV